MKNLTLLLSSLFFFSLMDNQDQEKIPQHPNKQLVIIHTNDLHSHLLGDSPEIDYTPLSTNDDHTTGGFSRIATLIRQEKENNPGTLIVDGGDFLMGTLFQSVEINTGFQLHLMQEMGYDAIAIGNHEFDFGIEAFSDYVNKANQKGIPQLLLSNIAFDKKDEHDDSFEDLYKQQLIKRYQIIEKDGIKIGLFALLGKEAYEVANAQPLHIENQIKTAKKIVKTLRKDEKVDVIIALSHSGIWYDNDHNLKMVEDAKVAQKVSGIDVIVSGHTHTTLPQPIVINNTLIVQTGEYGKNVGKLTLDISPDGAKLNSYELIPVDDRIMGDIAVHKAIKQQQKLLEKKVLEPLNYDYNEASFRLNYDLNYDLFDLEKCNIGNFIADAINYNVNQAIPEHNDISVIGHGMIRAPLDSGVIYLPEIFKIASLGLGQDNIPGYPLARVSLTAKEIKRLMDLLIKHSEKSTNYFMFTSGLKIDYVCKNGSYKKIKAIKIANKDGCYHTVDCSRKNDSLYSVVADYYMIGFLKKIKKMSMGLINIVPKDNNGEPFDNIKDAIVDFNTQTPGVQEGKAWLSIIEYAKSFETEKTLPVIPQNYNTAELRINAVN